MFFLPHCPFLPFRATDFPSSLSLSPSFHTPDLVTPSCLATLPQDQPRSKNWESLPLQPEKWSLSWQHFSTIVWKKNWFISEMVVFTNIVIKSATSDGFSKFKKFWHCGTRGMLRSMPDRQQLAQMPHSNAKRTFPLFPPRLYREGGPPPSFAKLSFNFNPNLVESWVSIYLIYNTHHPLIHLQKFFENHFK